MLLPAIVVLASLSIYPFIYLIRMSLMSFPLTPDSKPAFVGLRNWINAFGDPFFKKSWLLTVKYYLVALFLQMVLGTFMAVFISNIKTFRNTFTFLITTPMFLAPVLAGLVWRFLLNETYGIYFYLAQKINLFSFFGKIGLTVKPSFFASPTLALPSIILIDTWEWMPLIILIMLAGITSISPELLDAASIDGANIFQKFRYIMFPLLRPAFIVALLIRTMDLIRWFTKIFIITRGGPSDATKIIGMRTFEVAFRFYDLGRASAMALTILASSIVLGMIFVRIFPREKII
jgi:multiple sugar transport system permease protein